MITAKAPLRISFIGGGTDLLAYTYWHEGMVISAAIDKYIRTYNDYVQTPFDDCSGLGTSGAITVAKLKCTFPNITKKQLFRTAVQVERLGQQDQAIAIEGGFQFLQFKFYDYTTVPLISFPDFEKRLALVYLGKREVSATEILEDESKRLNFEAMHQSVALVKEAARAIVRQDLSNFIRIINEGWKVKKLHSPYICTPKILDAEEYYKKQGVNAFKLCGAGSGGYALLIKPEDLLIKGAIPIKFSHQGVQLESTTKIN